MIRLVHIRSRKDGSHYPITPKSVYAHTRPSFSPTQIWQKFNQSQDHTEKVKLKRAAVSIANRAQSQGNNDLASEYRKIADKMIVQSKPQIAVKSKHAKNDLIQIEKIGKTTVLADSTTSPAARNQVIQSFRRLPPAVQNEVTTLEIISNTGEQHKLGKVKFNAGAHWDKQNSTIRVFAPDTNKYSEWQKAEGIMTHEAGHAYWDMLKTKSEKETLPQNIKVAIDQLYANNEKAHKEIHQKYEPQLEKLYDERMELQNKSWGISHNPYATTAQILAHNNKIKQVEKEMRKVGKQRDTEIIESNKKNDVITFTNNVTRQSRPLTSALTDFEGATRKEGGLTGYSKAYVKSKKPTQFTENFAEAMTIWYSGQYPEVSSKIMAEKYPKTYAAFQKIITNDTQGHAVSLTDRPVEAIA